MPQLDITSFTSQILWLVTIYFTFYILLLKYILPRIGKILKFRKNYKISKIINNNKTQSQDLTKIINSKLANLVNINLEFLEKNNINNNITSKSESQYTYSDPLLKEQNEFLKKNLESLYIKKQLLEKYNHEKNVSYFV